MSGIALGAAFAAVQLVHRAHSKVKTSKARCARLVERCQFVVDRLERITVTKGGDAIVRERIHELERCAVAFEQTAQTIVQVGQQGVIASLLRSETNALLIESCNEALTELISLFNLEEIVDVRRWQADLEVARVRDHRELLSMANASRAATPRSIASSPSRAPRLPRSSELSKISTPVFGGLLCPRDGQDRVAADPGCCCSCWPSVTSRGRERVEVSMGACACAWRRDGGRQHRHRCQKKQMLSSVLALAHLNQRQHQDLQRRRRVAASHSPRSAASRSSRWRTSSRNYPPRFHCLPIRHLVAQQQAL
ncbi:hypothetical protein BJV77DRAFT_498775 [Russula vinacea]|nr:hypothetical protein BJV77DRAFT_498775 [Russula vinacea]